MKALMFDRFGLPGDVVSLREVEKPQPGAGEVLVRLLLSPIIPGDALYTQGLYPKPVRPEFPNATAGNYGVGVVTACGSGVEVQLGALVAVTYRGLWADYAIAPVDRVVMLPPDYRLELGAEFMNLVTASDLLDRAAVRPGQWLIVTGGHASVPAIVSQYAAAVGIHVLAVIRRRRADIDLGTYGADAVLALDEVDDVRAAVQTLTGGNAHGLIDCVGGPLFPDLLRSLTYGSQAIVYGGFDPAPFQLHNLDLLLNGLTIASYIYRYFLVSPATDITHVGTVLARAAELAIRVPTAGRFTLDEAAIALANDSAGGRRYFTWAAPDPTPV